MRYRDARMLLREPDREKAVEKIREGRLVRRIRRLMKSPSQRLIDRIQELERQRESDDV
jgi:hypothetical protein